VRGKIEKGDYQRFYDAATKPNDTMSGKPIIRFVNLYSPGGDLFEAMKIGRLLRKWMVHAHIGSSTGAQNGCRFMVSGSGGWKFDHKCQCNSACFFVFVGSVKRTGYGEKILGIHRPSFDQKYFSNLNAAQATQKYNQLLAQVQQYLREMGVPEQYYERMMVISSGDIEYLSDDEFEKYFEDYIPPIAELIKSRCGHFPKEKYDLYRSLSVDHYAGRLSDRGKKLYLRLQEKERAIRLCGIGELIKEQVKIDLLQKYGESLLTRV